MSWAKDADSLAVNTVSAVSENSKFLRLARNTRIGLGACALQEVRCAMRTRGSAVVWSKEEQIVEVIADNSEVVDVFPKWQASGFYQSEWRIYSAWTRKTNFYGAIVIFYFSRLYDGV